MGPPRSDEDLAGFPWDGAGLGGFLAGSATTLLGRVDFDDERHGSAGRVVAANPALARWLGGSPPADLAGVLSGRSRVRWQRCVRGLRRAGQARSVVLRLIGGAAGRRSWADYRVRVVPGAGGSVWLFGELRRAAGGAGVSRAALGRSRRRALVQAATDPLTGLGNRRQAGRWLAAAVRASARRGEALSCLLIDLDRFKAVNDEFGHPAGDAALRAAARTLARAVRSGDRVARFGGDEFLVLLPRTDRAGALAAAGRLRSNLAERPVVVRGSGGTGSHRIALRASVGLARHRPGETASRLVARADAALLRAKAAGGDRVEADP